SIIVPSGTNRLGLFKPTHCLSEPVVRRVVRARRFLSKSRLCAPLPNDSRVISPLVLIGQTPDYFLNLSVADRVTLGETIGHRQKKGYQSLLVIWFDSQHVQTNTLSRTRLVQQPIAHSHV